MNCNRKLLYRVVARLTGIVGLMGGFVSGASLYSNFGAGAGFTAGGVYTVSPTSQWVAVSFQPSQTATLNEIDLAFHLYNLPDGFTLEIANNAAGSPGTLLESINFNSGLTANGPSAVVSVFSSLHPNLAAGTTYWIIALGATANGLGGWNYTDANNTGGYSFSGNQGFNYQAQSGATPAFDVQGSSSTAPEPSTFVSIGLGIVLLGAFVRKSGIKGQPWTGRSRELGRSVHSRL